MTSLQSVLWFFFLIEYRNCLALTPITIGVLSTEENTQIRHPLNTIIFEQNDSDQKTSFYKSTFRVVSKYNSYEASKVLCDVLNQDEGVAAIFGVESVTSAGILRSINEHFNVPYITTSWQITPSMKDSTVLHFFPESELFAQGLADIVESLHWDSFVMLYETEEGLIKMQKILNLQKYEKGDKEKNIFVKQLAPGLDQRATLKEIKKLRKNNIILDCATENILPILHHAKEFGLLGIVNRVFLTSLDAYNLNYKSLNTRANITTIRIFNGSSEDLEYTIRKWERTEFFINNRRLRFPKRNIKTETILFHDALYLLMDSLNDLTSEDQLTTNSVSCNGSTQLTNGYVIVTDMKFRNASFSLSGPLEFDENGNRVNFDLNLVFINETNVVDIAVWNAKTKILNRTRSSSDNEFAAIANLQSITVQVYTKIGPPYLFVKEGEHLEGNERYEGFSVDLIDEVANITNFKYEIHLTKDNKYGSWVERDGKWDGLIGDILENRAHLAICDLTITHQRREVVDFSLPFMALGIGILYKEPDQEEINQFAFLDPFSIKVWLSTATLYLIISVVLYFTTRMTPGDWENPNPADENPEELENIWNIKNCLWLTLGSIMTQGSDILTKGISSRTLVSMWWFFSLVMANSYMANLTAFLTKNRMEPTITGAEALSKQTKIKYGAVEGASTYAFFQNSTYPTYAKMWTNMISSSPNVFESSNAEGVHRVEKSKKPPYAFLMESTQIEYETETKCNLKQIGDLLDSKSYGIAMPMNVPYRTFINKAILKMQENGKLAELKNRWWKLKRNETACDRGHKDIDKGDLNLTNLGGAFLVLGVGLAMAIIIGVSEFLWNVRNVSMEEHVSYWQALKVEIYFACAIWITKKKAKLLKSDSSSSSSNDTKDTIHLQPLNEHIE